MKNLLGITILTLLLLLITISFAFAADPAGGEIDYKATYFGNESISENMTTEPGNLTNLNIDATAISVKWAAFFGNISGGIKLADSSDNTFFDWIIPDVTGSMLYASDNAVVDWSSLNFTNSSDMPAFLTTSASDSYNNTFNINESHNFNGDSINANYVMTYNSSDDDVFKTYSLKTTGALVWASLVIDDEIGFQGNTIDYQLIVPAQEAVVTTYHFYLELV